MARMSASQQPPSLLSFPPLPISNKVSRGSDSYSLGSDPHLAHELRLFCADRQVNPLAVSALLKHAKNKIK